MPAPLGGYFLEIAEIGIFVSTFARRETAIIGKCGQVYERGEAKGKLYGLKVFGWGTSDGIRLSSTVWAFSNIRGARRELRRWMTR
jgi:hypothetical protein